MNFARKKSRLRRTSANVMEDYMNGRWRVKGKNVRTSMEQGYSSSDEDVQPQKEEITNWAEEFFGKNMESVPDYTVDQDVEVRLTKKQTFVLATLLPDQILLMEKMSACEPKRFVGVLLMADVSGFTALSERYNNTGKGGTYRLTVTLNTYLGALVELIYSHGGDIIKFAGDAFLACWKTDKKTFLCQTIHSVICCALVIQHSYAKYETDVKVNLRVKLAISAGNIMFSTIGANTEMNYVIFGLPVVEAKLAESVCVSGEVILTPNAWAHCYSRNYDHIVHKDGHVTIKTILYDPHELDVSKPFLGFAALLRQAKNKSYTAIENLPESFWDIHSVSASEALRRNEAFSLRKAILIAEQRDIGSQIRNFMIRPVLTQIDAHQPLEYLTEMRQVSILFVTLKPRECPPAELITIIDNSYQITCEMVYKSMGCVNKIILFDKDVMILVVFGLRGFKHESEAQAALKCAYGIKRSVSALDGVLEVSIGVTTGQVYCGVVGHPLRREFTVIGAIVNKAARLMCGFRNKITCDEATFMKSKMSKNGFTLQPQKELKGIGKPGKIYEYTEEIRVKELYNIPMIPPILNRIDEIEYIEAWLDNVDMVYRDFDALLLIGEPRIGKTRMMEWLARIARNRGHQVSSISLTSIHSANSYLALSQIMNRILGLTEPVTGFEKEQKIVELLKVYNDELCYLNHILKMRFAYPEGVFSLDEGMRRLKRRNMFKKLLTCIPEVHVILLDDLQNLDAESWEYIAIMLTSKKIFTVLSVTRGKFSTVHKWLYDVFIDDDIRKMVLGPLDPIWVPPLACQILDVVAVPNDLCNALRTNCKGMPGLIESFIVQLFSDGAIELKKISDEQLEEYKSEELQFPDPALLKPQAVDINKQEMLDQLLEEDSTGEISICLVTDKVALNANMKDSNVDALIMIQIDSLTPYQQLLLKIASVIGNVFSREILESIMYENNPITTAKAVKRLFSMRILSCANSKLKCHRKNGASIVSAISGSTMPFALECDCIFEYDPDNEEELPKYAFCQEMKFRNKNSRKTCYELLPMNQKKEFHTRVLNYLENNRQKCPECGGTIRILQSVSFQFEDLPHFDQSDDSDEAIPVNDTASEVLENVVSDILRRIPSDDGAASINSGRRRSTKRVTISGTSWKAKKKFDEENNIFIKIREVLEAGLLSEWHQIGVVDSTDNIEDTSRKHFKVAVEKGVSTLNLKKCKCAELSLLLYEQMIYHAISAEMKQKAVECLIHYSYLCLLAYNTKVALEKLEDAKLICDELLIPENYLKRYLGRIYSLKAACVLLNGRLVAARIEIDKAAKIYGLNIPKGSRNLKTIKQMFKFRRNTDEAMIVDSVFCLNVATALYNALFDDKTARSCSYSAIKLVQRFNCRVVDMCDAFNNSIQLELERGFPEATLEIEKIAKHCFRHLPQAVKAEELYALGKLFLGLFHANIARAELPPAVRWGFRSVVVSTLLNAYEVSLDIVPDLFYLLLARRRIEEAIDIAQLSLQYNKREHSLVSETWYYALCMDLILDCGFQLESPDEVSRFAEWAFQKKVDGPGWRRLVVNLWTYWLRLEVDKRAKKFELEALSWLSREDNECTPTALFSALRLAEGLLESLARKMDDLRKVVDMMELRSVADRELSLLEKDCKVVRTLYCRWLRLKGSTLALSGRQAASTAMFNQALEEGKRINNVLEAELARASLSHSKYWITNARNGTFASWQQGVEQMKDSWNIILYKISASRR